VDEDDWDEPTQITQITPVRPAPPPPEPAFDLVIDEVEDDVEDELEDLPELAADDLVPLEEIEELAPIDHEFPGGPAFVVLEPDEPARVFWVHDDLILGRGADVHIPIPSAAVSRRHASILLTAEGCVLEDLISDNGSFVNGERIERKVLWPGDTIRIASIELRFLGYTPAEQHHAGQPATALPRYAWQLPPGSDSETLMLDQRIMARTVRIRSLLGQGALRSTDGEAHWRLGHERHVLGGEGGIPVEGSVLERAAEISWTGSGHLLRKMARRDLLRVNGEPVTERMLTPGDEIQVARATFTYALD
jgi:pSer/pThr/pTyr-binding forkhead associated (FHA) protein